MPVQRFSLAMILLLALACSDSIRKASAAALCGNTINAYLICQNLDSSSVNVLEQALSDASAVFGIFSLEIDTSNVQVFPVDVLDGYHIWDIRFSADDLTSIPYLLLSHLDSNLHSLNVWKQNISTFSKPAAALPFKDSLQDINLCYNNADSIASGAFSDFSALSSLLLYDNSIPGLDVDDLSGLTKLRTLGLERNRISTIATGAFADLGMVTSLNLSNNALQSLQDGAFNGLQAVTFIDLSGNPFICDCSLQWLKDWLNGLGLLSSSNATCVYPVSAPFSNVDFCPSQAALSNETDSRRKAMISLQFVSQK